MAACCLGCTFPKKEHRLEEVERAMVELAMRQANRNQTQAARLLDISRDALRYKLKKFELVPAGDEEAADLMRSENLRVKIASGCLEPRTIWPPPLVGGTLKRLPFEEALALL